MDDNHDKRTAAERADDRAHYAHEGRMHAATALARAAMKHSDLLVAELPTFLRNTYATLTSLGAPSAEAIAPAAPEPLKPAVPVKKSVTDEHIVSLIDGSKLQTLSRHLTKHGYTPASYRAAFGLPDAYPMVAAAYSRKRKDIAEAQGLGKRGTPPKRAKAAA